MAQIRTIWESLFCSLLRTSTFASTTRLQQRYHLAHGEENKRPLLAFASIPLGSLALFMWKKNRSHARSLYIALIAIPYRVFSGFEPLLLSDDMSRWIFVANAGFMLFLSFFMLFIYPKTNPSLKSTLYTSTRGGPIGLLGWKTSNIPKMAWKGSLNLSIDHFSSISSIFWVTYCFLGNFSLFLGIFKTFW